MVVRESSNFEGTSSDEELSDTLSRGEYGLNQVKQITKSTDLVDKRLVNLFIYQKAAQEGLKFGFKNTVYTEKSNRKFKLPTKVYKDREMSDWLDGLLQADSNIDQRQRQSAWFIQNNTNRLEDFDGIEVNSDRDNTAQIPS